MRGSSRRCSRAEASCRNCKTLTRACSSLRLPLCSVPCHLLSSCSSIGNGSKQNGNRKCGASAEKPEERPSEAACSEYLAALVFALFSCLFRFLPFFISQSNFGRRHGKLFGWKIIHETWRQHANATATVTAKRECERELEIFVPNPNLIVTQTNCSGCRRCRLSLPAPPSPFPLPASLLPFAICYLLLLLLLLSLVAGPQVDVWFAMVWFGVSHIYVPIFSMWSRVQSSIVCRHPFLLACKFMVCPETIVIVFSTFA